MGASGVNTARKIKLGGRSGYMTKRYGFSLPLLALATALSAGMATAAQFTECPAVGGSGATDTGYQSGCAFLITVSNTGAVSITAATLVGSATTGTQVPSYDQNNQGNLDDTMVGILNNWTGHTILSVTLAGTGSFDYSIDAGGQDNPCYTGYTFFATGCGSSAVGSTTWPAPDSYGGPGVTSIIPLASTNGGTVSFVGVAAGTSAWFGLEGPISGTPTITFSSSGVPEPATVSLIGLGLVGVGFLGRLRRKRLQ